MRDINEPLRIAYAAALTGITDVPVYYQYLPNNLNPDNYIVFRSITSNDASTKGSFETSTNVTVEVHTKANIGNRGLSADTIADEIFQRIYGSRQVNLALSRGQVYNTEIANDVTQDFSPKNQFGYISRFITFRHLIFVEGSDPTGGNAVLVAGAVFRYEYTGTGGEAGFAHGDLQNKRIIEVSKDGIGCSGILTSGSPTDKEVLYNTLTGTLTFAVPFEPNEKSFVLYQLN